MSLFLAHFHPRRARKGPLWSASRL